MQHAEASGLYLHVPFCIRRCLYCDFYVEPLGTGSIGSRLREFRTRQHRAFLEAMDLELAALPDGFQPSTIYLGGGTPTEMPLENLEELFNSIDRHIDPSAISEFSCEANPGTMDAAMAELLLRSGVNRVSLGVQSFSDECLELLGRIHDAEQAVQTVHDLRNAGLQNLTIDLLFGLPESDLSVTARNLEHIETLQPEHVSWYSLEYEEGTGLTNMRDKGFIRESDEDQTAEEYERIRSGLNDLGYHQYELFSFAKPGFECAHNRNYWRGGSFHGCGPSAFSHVGGERRANVRDLGTYIHALKHDQPAYESSETLTAEAKARELLIIALRQTEGISISTFREQSGYTPEELAGPLLQEWSACGFLHQQNGRITLDPSAYLISDALFRELAP